MTKLSVNLNKIALLRNSRGRDFPNVVEFAKKFMALGVQGITEHPRQDERHITRRDTLELAKLLPFGGAVEFNIEGYPSEDFLTLVEQARPTQCTLVPDAPDQLTSDHGWDVSKHSAALNTICTRLQAQGIRVSIFLDPSLEQVEFIPATGAERIELYTEAFAAAYGSDQFEQVLQGYAATAQRAQALGIAVNAGHDLDLKNLSHFLQINGIEEVSIGHALMVECLEQGMEAVIAQYLKICSEATS